MLATLIVFLCKLSGDIFRQDRHVLVRPFAKKTPNKKTAKSESTSCVSFTEQERQENPELESDDESTLESVVTKSSSYFWPYFFHLYSSDQTVPLRLESPSPDYPQYHVYDHPVWLDSSLLWRIDPYELDPAVIPPPIREEECHGTLFRLSANFTYSMLGTPVIAQGSTFVFKGHTNPYVRHVVEWCQWQDQEHAYLKLVGMSASGRFFPYNDPNHPSFILVVPRSQSLVPYPPQLVERLCPPRKTIRRTRKFPQ